MAGPTIVLVHGAFADASSLRALYDELEGEDVFHESFCADVPAADAAFYAISQRPLAGVALSEPAPTPAWRSRPV